MIDLAAAATYGIANATTRARREERVADVTRATFTKRICVGTTCSCCTARWVVTNASGHPAYELTGASASASVNFHETALPASQVAPATICATLLRHAEVAIVTPIDTWRVAGRKLAPRARRIYPVAILINAVATSFAPAGAGDTGLWDASDTVIDSSLTNPETTGRGSEIFVNAPVEIIVSSVADLRRTSASAIAYAAFIHSAIAVVIEPIARLRRRTPGRAGL